MIPSRVTPALIELIDQSRLQIVVVIHCNHPHEIDDELQGACALLHAVCHGLLNQSVLLKGVNDTAKALCELSERLIRCRVMPYYLHTLDPVAGAMHFMVSIEHQHQLLEQVRSSLPGYLVPKCVSDVPGKPYKQPA